MRVELRRLIPGPMGAPDGDLISRAGGERALRRIIDDFYHRVFSDLMIGFYFRNSDRERLVQKELELVLSLLDPARKYTGADLRRAHAPHRIQGGHFDRRMQLLRDAIADAGLDAEVENVWLTHAEGLRSLITGDPRGRCDGAPPGGAAN